MGRCGVCGNEYDKTFQVLPGSEIFCCAHCAQQEGVGGLADGAG